jgi:hypothetical protein
MHQHHRQHVGRHNWPRRMGLALMWLALLALLAVAAMAAVDAVLRLVPAGG